MPHGAGRCERGTLSCTQACVAAKPHTKPRQSVYIPQQVVCMHTRAQGLTTVASTGGAWRWRGVLQVVGPS